ncbi:aspartate/glutamate racemase family protein [Halovivax gelatinilyticus]|uniref:aspartate/glutamate racemase family protein n=1 Tax=Halovivax gelatinilyticus TaxID=2961597 RepID=UPI0020CA997C|nr:amino acid racemase [Halovivax gelatinilyticus]
MTETDGETIGILGGMSSESTREYYRSIDAQINDVRGGHHAGDVVIRSVNFATIERCIRTERWDEASAILADAAADLERAGADFVVMATNTMHRVAPRIVEALTIPFVHIVDVAAEAVHSAGIDTVGLLGTRPVMDGSFYLDRFEAQGVETVVPEPADREAVDRIIFEELTKGVVRDASRDRYLAIIDDLVGRGAEGIVLGCTEIEMLVDQAACPDTPLFDTTALHVERAVERSLRAVES